MPGGAHRGYNYTVSLRREPSRGLVSIEGTARSRASRIWHAFPHQVILAAQTTRLRSYRREVLCVDFRLDAIKRFIKDEGSVKNGMGVLGGNGTTGWGA